MPYLKFDLACLRVWRMRQLPVAILLASPTFFVQAELYFNPRFLADDPAAVADLSGFEKGRSCRRDLSRRYLP